MDPYVAQTSEPNLLSPLKQKKTKWKVYRATRPTTKHMPAHYEENRAKAGGGHRNFF
jgi:hypothetical protein